MHNLDVGSFFTDHSMDKEDLIFQLLVLHSHSHLPKDLPTIKRMSKTIFRSTKVKHISNDKYHMFYSYKINQAKIFSVQHTKSELSVS